MDKNEIRKTEVQVMINHLFMEDYLDHVQHKKALNEVDSFIEMMDEHELGYPEYMSSIKK